MQQTTYTYRFYCLLMAAMVLLGSALPTGLNAKTMIMTLCDLQDGSPQHSHCEFGDFDGHQNEPDNASGEITCNLNFSCDCQIDRPPVQPETTLLSKTKSYIKLWVITYRATKDRTDNSTVTVDYGLSRQSDSSPPIFLKNLSFLN